jgi:hypothetical protein
MARGWTRSVPSAPPWSRCPGAVALSRPTAAEEGARPVDRVRTGDRAPAAMPAKPRPHDVPMDLIVTERRAVRIAGGVPTGTGASATPESPAA